MRHVARIRSDFPEKFGIPRQSGVVPELEAQIVFEPEFRTMDAVRGLEDFSHIWLIWEFSEARRRECQNGRLCHALPFPAKPHRAELCEAAGCV